MRTPTTGSAAMEGPRRSARPRPWYGSLSWIPFILVPATFLLLLFPDGHLLSPRWRPIAWCAALGIAGNFVTTGLTAGPLEDYPQLMNPYGVTSSVLDPLTGLSFLALIVGIGGSAVSLILRFRRATGEERVQIKWLALAGAIVAVIFPIALVLYDVWGEAVSNVAIMLSVLGLPIAAGVAILRYRLYDIDVVINRTLVYGALTVILAGHVSRQRAAAAAASRRSDRRLRPRGGGLDARGRRAVPPGADPRSRASSTGGSIGASTTPRRPWKASRPGCETRST